MADFSLKTTDSGPMLVYRCGFWDSDGTFTAFDLTGAAGTFAMWDPKTGTMWVDDEAAIVIGDPTNGEIGYPWATDASDTTDKVTAHAEFHVTGADGREYTFPNDSYLVVRIAPRVASPPVVP
jgi:hypothetical protein